LAKYHLETKQSKADLLSRLTWLTPLHYLAKQTRGSHSVLWHPLWRTQNSNIVCKFQHRITQCLATYE